MNAKASVKSAGKTPATASKRQPAASAKPVTPAKPVSPAKPVKASAPVKAAVLFKAVKPARPVVLVKPVNAVAKVKHVKAGSVTSPVAPAKPVPMPRPSSGGVKTASVPPPATKPPAAKPRAAVNKVAPAPASTTARQRPNPTRESVPVRDVPAELPAPAATEVAPVRRALRVILALGVESGTFLVFAAPPDAEAIERVARYIEVPLPHLSAPGAYLQAHPAATGQVVYCAYIDAPVAEAVTLRVACVTLGARTLMLTVRPRPFQGLPDAQRALVLDKFSRLLLPAAQAVLPAGHPLLQALSGQAVPAAIAPATATASTPPRAILNFDGLIDDLLQGWAYDPSQPGKALSLQVFCDDRLVARGPANRFRADLKVNAIGNGYHHFRLPLSYTLQDGIDHALRIQVLDGARVVQESRQVVQFERRPRDVSAFMPREQFLRLVDRHMGAIGITGALVAQVRAHLDDGCLQQELLALNEARYSYQAAGAWLGACALVRAKIAETWVLEDNLAQGLESYQAALSLDPDCAWIHLGLGSVLEKSGRPQEAADSYRACLSYEPGWGAVQRRLGRMLGDLRQSAQPAPADLSPSATNEPIDLEQATERALAVVAQLHACLSGEPNALPSWPAAQTVDRLAQQAGGWLADRLASDAFAALPQPAQVLLACLRLLQASTDGPGGAGDRPWLDALRQRLLDFAFASPCLEHARAGNFGSANPAGSGLLVSEALAAQGGAALLVYKGDAEAVLTVSCAHVGLEFVLPQGQQGLHLVAVPGAGADRSTGALQVVALNLSVSIGPGGERGPGFSDLVVCADRVVLSALGSPLQEALRERPRFLALAGKGRLPMTRPPHVPGYFVRPVAGVDVNFALRDFVFERTGFDFKGDCSQLNLNTLIDYYHSRFGGDGGIQPRPLSVRDAEYIAQPVLRFNVPGAGEPLLFDLIDCGNDQERARRIVLNHDLREADRRNILMVNLRMGDAFLNDWMPGAVRHYASVVGTDPFFGLPCARLHFDEVSWLTEPVRFLALAIEAVLCGEAEGGLALLPPVWSRLVHLLLRRSAALMDAVAGAARAARPAAAHAVAPAEAPPISLIGHFNGSGLGANAIMLKRAILARSPALQLASMGDDSKVWLERSATSQGSDREGVPRNLFSVNGQDVVRAAMRHAQVCARSGARNYGFFLWETSVLPSRHLVGAEFVDTILVPSSFLVDVFRQSVPDAKVVNIRKFIEPGAKVAMDVRRSFNIRSAARVFITIADFGSSIERKNILGAVQAFKRAVANESEGVLLIKLRKVQLDHWSNRAGHWQKVLREIDGDARFRVLTTDYSDAEYWGLLDGADALLSMHRGEGFGYGMAHMLSLGKPVITTNYSGTTDFCTEATALLVDFKLVEVEPWMMGCKEAIGMWADPNLDSAAAAIRSVITDPALARSKAARGQALLKADYSLEAFSARLAAAMAD
jgi:glycosyltransferase involved in cell wall biosynthesis/tetratricopeptide (TPR) repeat protein